MTAAQYAEALYLATRDKDEAATERLVERFVALVREHGHERLLPRILHECEVLERTRATSDVCVVKVARDTDVSRHEKRITEDKHTLGADTMRTAVTVDPRLIGGYAITANGTRLDRSYRRRLLDLYHTLITSV